MNQDQTNSLVRSALKLVGMGLMTHGYTVAANFVNTEDCFGIVVVLIGMWLSHQHHALTKNEIIDKIDDIKDIIHEFGKGPVDHVPVQLMIANAENALSKPTPGIPISVAELPAESKSSAPVATVSQPVAEPSVKPTIEK